MFYFFYVQKSTFIQIQSCPLLLVAAQGWRTGFQLTGAYFVGRAYITRILKNHARAYFQGNGVIATNWQGAEVYFGCIIRCMMRHTKDMSQHLQLPVIYLHIPYINTSRILAIAMGYFNLSYLNVLITWNCSSVTVAVNYFMNRS